MLLSQEDRRSSRRRELSSFHFWPYQVSIRTQLRVSGLTLGNCYQPQEGGSRRSAVRRVLHRSNLHEPSTLIIT